VGVGTGREGGRRAVPLSTTHATALRLQIVGLVYRFEPDFPMEIVDDNRQDAGFQCFTRPEEISGTALAIYLPSDRNHYWKAVGS